jgi:hypothetical protein
MKLTSCSGVSSSCKTGGLLRQLVWQKATPPLSACVTVISLYVAQCSVVSINYTGGKS